MSRRVALVRTDISEELGATIIRVTRIGELGPLAIISNRRTLGLSISSQHASVASYS
jgi:Flp pilus assembly pilin Flp